MAISATRRPTFGEPTTRASWMHVSYRVDINLYVVMNRPCIERLSPVQVLWRAAARAHHGGDPSARKAAGAQVRTYSALSNLCRTPVAPADDCTTPNQFQRQAFNLCKKDLTLGLALHRRFQALC